MYLPFGLLTLGPRIRKQGETLVVTTGRKTAIVTLGLALRRVTVDPQQQTVTIESRHAWMMTRRRVVPFQEIRAITYGYADQSVDQYFDYTHNAVDVYRIGLRLTFDREVHLFRFIGEGAWTSNSPFPDWMHWHERVIDLMGTQDRDSLALVELLSELIGVRVRPPS